MDDDDLHDALADVFDEIKIVTGAQIYADEEAQAWQLEVLKRFIQRTPKYMRLHAGEITQAFYMNAAGAFPETYRHYNREMNAEFIGDVLNAYIRWMDSFLGKKLGLITAALNPPADKPKPVFSPEFWKAEVLRDIDFVRARNARMIYNTERKYELLRRLGYIRINSRAHWWRWYRFAIDRRRERLLREAATTQGAKITKKKTLEIFDAILTTGALPVEQHRGYVQQLRREIYLTHLEAFAACGVTDPFREVRPMLYCVPSKLFS